MRIWPIGVCGCKAALYGPVWACGPKLDWGTPRLLDASSSRLAVLLWLIRQGVLPPGRLIDLAQWSQPPLNTDESPKGPNPEPSPLNIRWPSDEPAEPEQIIVVERLIQEPPPDLGVFLDMLY